MKLVAYQVQDRIGAITLNRPEKRNALSYELVTDLKEALNLAEKDDQVKVVILKANGEAFCAGADLAYLQQLQKYTYEENLQDSNHLKELFLKIYTFPKIVIAQIQGHALAGGCGLATVCDFSYAVPEAKFGYTEVKIGFIPALVSIFLLRKIGEARSKELLLGGELFSAELAVQMGLINKVVPAEKLESEVLGLARKLADGNSGQSMKLTKQMVAQVQSLPLNEALNYATEMNARARGTEDCKRGIAAFLNKEKLTW
ncbi:MAG TPA: enoyl-CoA hydratase/isomerase family protein [Cyclobacteriaceae bacterium]|nr:enoyl-CoA hydratase/isomerase family protein [Cyclobacteriaceae bacterium]